MEQFSEAIRFQHYRLMVISTWPESEAKQAAAMSAHAALNREMQFLSCNVAVWSAAATELSTSIS